MDVALLNSTCKKANYRKETKWPPGKRQRLTKAVAKRLFDAISTSLDSLFGVLQKNPDFPPHDQIYSWRINVPWFAEGFRTARKEQAEFMVQHCLEIAKNSNPKNAHSQRVKFDIYKWVAAKFAPDVYGDKPATQQTTVNVGLSISTERLNEIRSKLNLTRSALTRNGDSNRRSHHLDTATSGSQPSITES